jgi:outer membrane lipase/esterase
MVGLVRCKWLVAIACIASMHGANAGYSSLFIFGDSLSDSGNNALVLAPNVTPVPISGNTFIPTFPYASGHYSNGPVWAQTLASALGLSALPSLLPGGTDYAFGGARTGPVSNNLLNPFPPSLETQTAFFLSQHGNVAPSSALYVVAGGGNNARDALNSIAGCGTMACVLAVVQAAATGFATDIATIVGELELAGATHIVVWDTPDVGLAPAVIATGGGAIGTALSQAMNSALLATVGGDPDVMLFDLFGLQDKIAANPAAFGLTNVTDACAQFAACDPSKYLFWDGIHPTSEGHLIIGDAMIALVPEPATFALLGLALAGLAVSRRRASA